MPVYNLTLNRVCTQCGVDILALTMKYVVEQKGLNAMVLEYNAGCRIKRYL
jgi:hypothetical protein